MFDHSFLYQRNSTHGSHYDGTFYLSLISERDHVEGETIHARRKYARFKLWEVADSTGTTLETAFARGENEGPADYQKRMGGTGPKPRNLLERLQRGSHGLVE